MRLVTVPVSGGTEARVATEQASFPISDPTGRRYVDVGAVLADGEVGLGAARAALAGDEGTNPTTPVRPIIAPGAVICVGLNYRSHILEMGRDLPSAPALFSKLPRSLTDPYAVVELPSGSEQVDYEGELGVVIGAGGRHLAPERAWEAVAGLTVVNDVTARDFQRRSPQWFAGKTFQASTPVGPAVVTRDEFPDGIADLELRVTLNGELRQQAPLGDLVFDVPALIADISQIVELRPGDIIATGTPGGVIAGSKTPVFIASGDVVEVTIDRVGTLRNEFSR